MFLDDDDQLVSHGLDACGALSSVFQGRRVSALSWSKRLEKLEVFVCQRLRARVRFGG